jgi:hypothetical protein
MDSRRPSAPQGHPAHRILLGLGVMALGGAALIDNLNYFHTSLVRTFWPLALVLFGIGRLISPGQLGRMLGVALVLAGVLLTARNLGFTDFSLLDWWPVFIILAGLGILLRGIFPRGVDLPAPPPRLPPYDGDARR